MIEKNSNGLGRYLDATAANLIAAHKKVLQIMEGETPIPEVVEIFLTNYCKFACPFCRCAKHHGNKSQYFDYDALARLLDEFQEKGVRTIELGGGGEPLEHPMISDILRRFIRGRFRIGVITNGYVITQQPDLSELFLQCADWVRFSSDAITDDVYRIVHGRESLSYTALREAIKEMVRMVRTQPEITQRPKIGLKLVVQQPNEHQILAAVDEAISLGVNYLQFKWLESHQWSIPFERRNALVERLNDKVAQLSGELLTVDLLPGYGGQSREGRCMMSVLHPLIDWDGVIYICAFFHHRKESHAIGDIKKGKFFDCWGSPHHRERIGNVDPTQCVPNCPLLRYNSIIKFIREESFRFRYI